MLTCWFVLRDSTNYTWRPNIPIHSVVGGVVAGSNIVWNIGVTEVKDKSRKRHNRKKRPISKTIVKLITVFVPAIVHQILQRDISDTKNVPKDPQYYR